MSRAGATRDQLADVRHALNVVLRLNPATPRRTERRLARHEDDEDDSESAAFLPRGRLLRFMKRRSLYDLIE